MTPSANPLEIQSKLINTTTANVALQTLFTQTSAMEVPVRGARIHEAHM